MLQNNINQLNHLDLLNYFCSLTVSEICSYDYSKISEEKQELILNNLRIFVLNKKLDFGKALFISLGLFRPSIFFRSFTYNELLKYFPELAAAIGCKQNPEYHVEDVFDHTMTCLDNFEQYKNKINFTGDHLLMKLSLLFHDLGKPEVKSVK